MTRKKIILFGIILLVLGCGIGGFLKFRSSKYYALRPYIPALEKLRLKANGSSYETNDVTGRIQLEIPESQHLDAFQIDQIPVTIQDYKKCAEAGACYEARYQDEFEHYYTDARYALNPVTYVSWFDAERYCEWAGGTLPTALEWETAAGFFYDDRLYPWGNEPVSPARANVEHFYGDIIPAGWLPYGRSPYQVLDLAGNAREWVLDVYEVDYAPDGYVLSRKSHEEILREATSTEDYYRVLKGCGDADDMEKSRIVNMAWHGPGSAGYNRGFRCAYVTLPGDVR